MLWGNHALAGSQTAPLGRVGARERCFWADGFGAWRIQKARQSVRIAGLVLFLCSILLCRVGPCSTLFLTGNAIALQRLAQGTSVFIVDAHHIHIKGRRGVLLVVVNKNGSRGVQLIFF